MDSNILNTDTASNGATPPAAQTPLMERVVQGAHDTIDRLAEHAAPHVQQMQESVSEANTKLHERADQARELGAEWTETLRSTVREHPVAALATALAAGLLIARLTRPAR